MRSAAPVFAAVGEGAWGPVQELRACRSIELVASPRHAAVLLVAGPIAGEHRPALVRVHDQLPHPRLTVGWHSDLGGLGLPQSLAAQGATADDVVDRLAEAWESVRAHAVTEPDLLPDVEPNEWRGVGPHGQGGEGMMGGVPYGRPMAMTGPDRDGLALDRMDLTAGPFLPVLPPGVVLDLALQGDVIQSAAARRPPAPDGGSRPFPGADDEVPPRRADLRWLAHALHVHGLEALAVRAATAAAAMGVTGEVPPGVLVRLRRAVRASGLLWSLRGVGHLDGRGDCRDRWQERLDRLVAGDPSAASAGDEVVGQLCGLSWPAAVATLVSAGWTGGGGPVRREPA